MKKFYFVLLTTFISLSAFSQYKESSDVIEQLLWDDKMLNILIDTRIDVRTETDNGNLNELRFYGQALKIWFAGEVIPGIRYRVRHRLNRSESPFQDGYSYATDYAWLAFDIGKNWTITAGKQSVQLGTFEYDYGTADVYLSSMVNSDFINYKTGIEAAYKFSDQLLHFQLINSDPTQFATEKYKNKALAALVMWEGALFKKVLDTRIGYGIFQHDSNTFYNWLTAGLQLNTGRFTTELDYYLGERNMDYGSVVGIDLGRRFVRDQSAALNLEYNSGKWRPAIKGVWNQRYDKGYNSTAYDSWGIQAVMEYYPFSHSLVKDLRFHLMYSYSHTDFKGPFVDNSNLNSHTILFGTRWLFKAK